MTDRQTQNSDIAVLEIIHLQLHLQLILSRFKLNRCLIKGDRTAFVLFPNVAIKIGAWTCEPRYYRTTRNFDIATPPSEIVSQCIKEPCKMIPPLLRLSRSSFRLQSQGRQMGCEDGLGYTPSKSEGDVYQPLSSYSHTHIRAVAAQPCSVYHVWRKKVN